MDSRRAAIMDATTERAQTYRFRAEELRSMSDHWIDPGTRMVLERVALDYDRMADRLEGKQAPPYPRPGGQAHDRFNE
jgi:hypothetical protein